MKKKKIITHNYSSQKTFVTTLSVLSSFYAILVLKDVVLSGNISSGLSLSELRGGYIDEVEQVRTLDIFNILKGLSKSFAIAFISLSIVFKLKKQKFYFHLSIIIFIFVFIETTFQGGRTSIVYCIVLAVIVYVLYILQTKRVNPIFIKKRNIVILFFSTLTLIIVVFGIFPTLRNPALLDGIAIFINLHHSGAELSPNVAKIVYENPSFNGLLGLTFGSTYISAPLVKFTYYLDEIRVYEWYGMGTYNFPLIEKMVTFSNKHYYEIREAIRENSYFDKHEGNPWSTAYRDFSIDFGIYGALIMSFLSGYYLRLLFNLHQKYKKSIFYLLIGGLSTFSSMLIPFYSPFVVIGQIIIILGIYQIGIYLITFSIQTKQVTNRTSK